MDTIQNGISSGSLFLHYLEHIKALEPYTFVRVLQVHENNNIE